MKRNLLNPILTRENIPDVLPRCKDVSSVFNPGAVKVNGEYLLLLRVQNRGRETMLMLARSLDGIQFSIEPRIIVISGMEHVRERVYHLYDPRITALDGIYYIMLAADTDAGCRLATVRTGDFIRFDLVGFDGCGDTRNGVLFPERIGGKYLRLERPNQLLQEGSAPSGHVITLSESDDLRTWRDRGQVMAGRPRFWDEIVGAGPPPVKTREGWLLVYHGVATHFASVNIYQAGVALLDLHNPSQVLGRSRCNILEPREEYEQVGQVPNVVFPSGMVVEQFDNDGFALPGSPVNVYYGAADTCVCLATTTVQDLINSCGKLNELP